MCIDPDAQRVQATHIPNPTRTITVARQVCSSANKCDVLGNATQMQQKRDQNWGHAQFGHTGF